MTDQLLLWVDKETNDLEVRDCLTLETAGFLTTADFHVLHGSEFHFLLDMTPGDLHNVMETCDPFVREMHEKDGLWDALAGRTEGDVDRIDQATMDARIAGIVLWAIEMDPTELMAEGEVTDTKRPDEGYRKGPRVSGSGVTSFDLQIIRFQYPQTAALLDYRTCDVSQIREFLRDQCGYNVDELYRRPEDQKAHRAMLDVIESWEQARILREKFSFAIDLPMTSEDFPSLAAVEGDYSVPEFDA